MTTGDLDRQTKTETGPYVARAVERFDLPIPMPDPDTYWRCIERFVEEVGSSPYVDRIYVDVSRGLDFYAVYCGELFQVGREMMEATGRAIDYSPQLQMDFHFISEATIGREAPSSTTLEVFAR